MADQHLQESKRGRWDAMSEVEQFDYVVGLEATVARLRQGLWDVAALAGVDTDGCDGPEDLAYPDIVDWATYAVCELRDDYNAALGEIPGPGGS